MQMQPLSALSRDEILAGLFDALAAEQQSQVDYGAQAQLCRLRTEEREAQELADIFEALRDVEQDHARRLAARIAALGGSPTRQAMQPQPGGEALSEWLVHDLRGEQWAIVEYARLIAGTLDDDNTVELMTELLLDELRHARWLKAALRGNGRGAAGVAAHES
jgi:bacterioferritin (cytochrome b1)